MSGICSAHQHHEKGCRLCEAEKWEEENEQLKEDNSNLWEGIKLLRRGLREEADAILEKVLMRIRRGRER